MEQKTIETDYGKPLFVKCQCSTHCFEIEYYYYEENDSGFNLTFWNYGRNSEILCWRERIRWIWKIIRTGNPWADGIMISSAQAKEIENYINKHSSKE
jgi:hypothetical protein